MKAAIFDFDGVIVDTEPLYYEMLGEIYEDLGIEMDEETNALSLGCNSSDWWHFIVDKYGLDIDPAELSKLESQNIIEILKDKETPQRIFPDLENFLRKLKNKGIRCAIASANVPDLIEDILVKARLDKYFDVIVSTDDVSEGKPAPDVFLYAAKKLGIDPKDAVVIEDSSRGLEGAKRAGMTSLAFLSAPVPIDLSFADLQYCNYGEILKNLDTLIQI